MRTPWGYVYDRMLGLYLDLIYYWPGELERKLKELRSRE